MAPYQPVIWKKLVEKDALFPKQTRKGRINAAFAEKIICKERKFMVDFEFRDHYTFADLVKIVGILRRPGGCPWDREQTHASLRRCLMEETCEVLEAIDRGDSALLCEELGDVLLQVVFHASLAEDEGEFDMDAVADGICQKMIYRHPHVFGTEGVSDVPEVLANWEILKRQEKGQETYTDTLNAVAGTLPALWRAEKLQKKAARGGFAWPDASGALEKLEEEVRELNAAMAGDGDVFEEVGDVLFAAVNAARYAGIDPEEALHASCGKYISRFAKVEQTALDQGRPLDSMTAEEMIQAWNQAKETEHNLQEDKKT